MIKGLDQKTISLMTIVLIQQPSRGHNIDILGTTINSEDDEEHSRYSNFTEEVNRYNPNFEIVRVFNDH